MKAFPPHTCMHVSACAPATSASDAKGNLSISPLRMGTLCLALSFLSQGLESWILTLHTAS
jgi:hypothetical protein